MPEVRKSWLLVSILLGVLRTVNVQFAMPMPMFAPPPPPPPPPMLLIAPPPPPVQVPVGVPYPVPVPVIVTRKTTTTTTTTTTESAGDGDGGNMAIAVPLPFGFPMPFAVPQAPPPTFCADKKRPKQCPPCPPCVCTPGCTPAFYSYCSPCHQKCRCKGNGSAPAPEPPKPPPPVPGGGGVLPMLSQPMPMPVYPMAPAPPPVFIFPMPPALSFRRPPRRIPNERAKDKECRSSSSSSSSGSSSGNSDSDSDWRRRRRRYKIRRTYKNYRKNAKSWETDDDKGIVIEKDKLVKPMLSYISKQGKVKFEKKISENDAQHLMRETEGSNSVEVGRRSANVAKDRRKIVFSPPADKKISNLTVSFNVV